MERNVFSWNVAINNGHQPRLYSYAVEDIPLGTYVARLDFKIWAKKVLAVSCYFTQVSTGIRFQVTVYAQRDGVYHLPGDELDFTVCPIDREYSVCLQLSRVGNVVLTHVRLL